MEDLGNINITIREAIGGTGASGNVGGGPARRESVDRDMATALDGLMEAHQAQVQNITRQASQQATQGILSPALLQRFIQQQDIQSELMSFARRPSVGSATMLLREHSATQTVLKGLGTAGVALGVGFVAIGAIAGTVTMALAGLRRASEHAASRIEETWRYSAATAAAMGEQQVRVMGATIEEISQNSQTYARTIRQQTDVSVSQIRFDAELAKTTNVLARTFARLQVVAYDLGTQALKTNAAWNLLGPGGQAIRMALEASDMPVVKKTAFNQLSFLQHVNSFFTYWIGGEAAFKKLLVSYLAQIDKNTKNKKDPMDIANEWFQADIQYLTGSRF